MFRVVGILRLTTMNRSPLATILAATAALLLLPTTALAAKTGTLSVTAKGAPKLAKKAKRTVDLRIVDLSTGAVVEAKSQRKSAAKLKLAPGGYIVALRATDLPGRTTEGLSKLVVVRAGKTTRVKLALKKLKRSQKPAKRLAGIAGTEGFFAPPEETAGKLILGIDPNTVIRGVRGYDQGLAIDSVIATPLSEGCEAGEQELVLVEIRRRGDILEELGRANDPRFDPTNVVRPGKLLRERQMLRGGGELRGNSVTIELTVVDVATGREIARGSAKGSKKEIFDVIEDAARAVKKNLCAKTNVDVEFTGSGSYSRDEGTSATDSEDHIRASYSWQTTFRGVSLDAATGSLNFASASSVTGNWKTDGRYGAEGPGNYSCAAPVVGYSGEFASLTVERVGGRAKLTAQPFLMIQGDVFNTACSGLPSPPFASFTFSGSHPANQAHVEFSLADLAAAPQTFAVAPQSVVAPDCSDMIADYESPCTQSANWSGTVTVTKVN